MTIRNLHKIFAPESVAVIGASTRLGSVGNTVLKNLVSGGFAGDIHPVNPKFLEIETLATVANVSEISTPVDLAIVCTPARTVAKIVRECGEAGIQGLVILSAGFRETGESGVALQKELAGEAAKFSGMRIIGPNCLGIIAPHASLNASFAAGMPGKGRVAFISQSGALCTAVLDWALQENIGFANFVSVGNSMDVGVGDLIDYFSDDPETDSIILYVESISNPREFMSAARAFTRRKPIIAYKAGRFPKSAEAAASHTGAMAGVDSVYEAAFKRAGIVRVREMSDMFDCAELLARKKRSKGPKVAIVTNAGGPGVMATDELLTTGGTLAQLNETTIASLNNCLPANWSHGNPIDVIGDATPERFAAALKIVLDDDQVDAVIALFAPQAMSAPTEAAKAVIDVEKQTRKPILTSWMGGKSMQEAIALFNAAGVSTYWSPEQAVRAFSYLNDYSRNREILYETPRDMPVEFPLDRTRLRAVFNTILSEGRDILSESTSKALLEAYEIPVTKPYVARSVDDAVRLGKRLGYPVAMKIMSPDITHKTDVGGVSLNLVNDAETAAAFEHMLTSAKAARPDAHLEGVTIQRMFSHPRGIELIVGAKRDAAFGTVLLVGAGGTTAEIFQDRALELPPLNERLARRMLESLRSWPLLQGYRGAPRANLDRLIEVLIRISYLVADYPEIKELDINPLVVTPEEVIALDARVILDHETMIEPPAAYSHLAIRPYPHEYERLAKLKNETTVWLRPIKPEDEPKWHAMLSSCSRQSLWFRFQYLFKVTTHEMATRFCFIDYDREMAIVAEIEEAGERKLIGVGRLVANPDHTNAEYAVLVADAYQGCGLGSLLTDHCLEICEKWGINLVVAEVAPANGRMLSIFKHRNFELDRDGSPDIVLARRNLVRSTQRDRS
jgi:acetyltransferase